MSEDSVDFYLADFRSDNSAEDYIVKNWKYLDLTPLGNMDSLQLSLSSSDVGVFGMNTPAYCCVDRISSRAANTPLRSENVFQLFLYPNPAADFVQFEIPEYSNATLSVFRYDGLLVHQEKLFSAKSKLDIRRFPVGNYQVQIKNKDLIFYATLIKH